MEEENIQHEDQQGWDTRTTRQSAQEKRKSRWMNDFFCQVNFTIHKDVLTKDTSNDYTPRTYPFVSPRYLLS